MKWIAAAAGIALSALPAHAQPVDATAGKVRWRDGSEYEQGLVEARQKGLPILLFFKQDW